MSQCFNGLYFHWIGYIVCFLFISSKAIAQDLNSLRKTIKASYVADEIVIDGILDEETWTQAQFVDDFMVQEPVDDRPASKRTSVKVAYDDKAIYISAVCYDDTSYVVQTLKRDNFGDSDEFGILFDPMDQKAYAFAFGVSVFGTQTEALATADDDDLSWDNKWSSATQQYEEYWTVEMAIPFKTLRFESDRNDWGIQFFRVEPSLNELYVWSPVPRQFNFLDLGYTGKVNWETAPQKTGSNIALIPYSTLAVNKDYTTDSDSETIIVA